MTLSITLRDDGQRIYLVGDTYPVKDQIKGIGGRWDAAVKAWWVSPQKRAEAEALIGGKDPLREHLDQAEAAYTEAVKRLAAAKQEMACVVDQFYAEGKTDAVMARMIANYTEAQDAQQAVEAARITVSQAVERIQMRHVRSVPWTPRRRQYTSR